MSRVQDVVTNLIACADIRVNGARPWDIQVHDPRFFNRVLASETLGFGESYMDGWWDCDALDMFRLDPIPHMNHRVDCCDSSNRRVSALPPCDSRLLRALWTTAS